MLRTWSLSAGLSLLYASSYFLPLLSPTQSYFLPSGRDVVWPSLLVLLVLTPAIVTVYGYLGSHPATRRTALLLWISVTALTAIAILSLLEAADVSVANWIAQRATQHGALVVARWLKIFLTLAVVVLVSGLHYVFRARWRSTLAFLAILGFAYAIIGLARLQTRRDHFTPCVACGSAPAEAASDNRSGLAGPEGARLSRRVVWIIFDEMDYGQSLGAEPSWVRTSLPNLLHLQAVALSATQAFSPARDTQESVAALLMGTPVAGSVIDGHGTLSLDVPGADLRLFSETNSVFAHLAGGPSSGAVLGYYHPYCKVLPSVKTCLSSYMGNAGRWFDGLFFFSEQVAGIARWLPHVPAHTAPVLWSLFDPMYRISETEIAALPALLSRQDKSLIFIHLNVPHYPADYAQKALDLTPTAHDHEAYVQNLLLVDRLTGQIQNTLQHGSSGDVLLLISSDHWHRMDSIAQARPIPFLAWHVGETQGVLVTSPISTMHTSALILEFLAARLTTQAQIAAWWGSQRFVPTYVPANRNF